MNTFFKLFCKVPRLKVHVISTWLQVVDEVVTKMRFLAGGRAGTPGNRILKNGTHAAAFMITKIRSLKHETYFFGGGRVDFI